MSRNLSQITNQNTFGVWKTRTNDIISVIGSVVTIGDSETNTGNIVIDGNVSASGTLFVDTIQETSGNGNNLITINSDLGVEGDIIMDQSSGATTLTYSLANTPTWTIGTSADHTTLDIKKGATYLRITDSGSLTGANLTIDADLFPTSGDPIALDTTGNAGTATAWETGRTITLTGDVTGTSTAFDGSSDLSFAVTVDDAFQAVTRVVRGSDLLNSTPRQIYLQQCLGYKQPSYAHVPIAVTSDGKKLSKQNLATSLPAGNESSNLCVALDWLQQCPPHEYLP